MTLEECLRLPAVVLAENFLFLCCCPALPVWPWMERPALKARDKLGWPAPNCTLLSNPSSCLMLHSTFISCCCHLRFLLPSTSSLLQLCRMGAAAAALNSCRTEQAVATAAPVATAAGREILDAACRPCRHWQPAKSTAPTVVCQPMRGEICRAISQSEARSPVCWREAAGQLCRRRWQPQVERASMYSSPIPVPDSSARVSPALATTVFSVIESIGQSQERRTASTVISTSVVRCV